MATTISELITTMRGTRSYEQLAKDCGGAPTAGRIQQLAAKDQNTFPSPESIRGLAQGLGVSSRAVVLACATSLGLSDTQPVPPLVSFLPNDVAHLTPGQVRATLGVVKQFIECNKATTSEEAMAGV